MLSGQVIACGRSGSCCWPAYPPGSTRPGLRGAPGHGEQPRARHLPSSPGTARWPRPAPAAAPCPAAPRRDCCGGEAWVTPGDTPPQSSPISEPPPAGGCPQACLILEDHAGRELPAAAGAGGRMERTGWAPRNLLLPLPQAAVKVDVALGSDPALHGVGLVGHSWSCRHGPPCVPPAPLPWAPSTEAKQEETRPPRSPITHLESCHPLGVLSPTRSPVTLCRPPQTLPWVR